MKPEDAIEANAELVRKVAAEQLGIAVGYDCEAVRWLDGYLDAQHASGDKSLRQGLVRTLGSFFGECIRNTYGGVWVPAADGWGIRISDSVSVFPFAKVGKHLESGQDESVWRMFEAVAALLMERT